MRIQIAILASLLYVVMPAKTQVVPLIQLSPTGAQTGHVIVFSTAWGVGIGGKSITVSAIANVPVSFTHGLNSTNVRVLVFDNTNTHTEVQNPPVIIDANTVQVTFPVSGTFRILVK